MRINGINVIYEDKYHAFMEDVISNEYYSVIRQNADTLLKASERDFAYDFDYAIAKSAVFPIEITDPVSGEKIDDATEYIFLNYINLQAARAHIIMEEYIEHCEKTGKRYSDELDDFYNDNIFKRGFIDLKMRRATSANEVKAIKNSVKNFKNPIKESKLNTLKGKKLNLLERYEIAKEVFGLERQLRILNISEGEKTKLLSLILDCNSTNARHIMNGKYPGKIRKDIISEYISNLKK